MHVCIVHIWPQRSETFEAVTWPTWGPNLTSRPALVLKVLPGTGRRGDMNWEAEDVPKILDSCCQNDDAISNTHENNPNIIYELKSFKINNNHIRKTSYNNIDITNILNIYM